MLKYGLPQGIYNQISGFELSIPRERIFYYDVVPEAVDHRGPRFPKTSSEGIMTANINQRLFGFTVMRILDVALSIGGDAMWESTGFHIFAMLPV